MCGLIGYITLEEKSWLPDRRRFLTEGLIVDTLRGFDSTGMFYGGHDFSGKPGWLKHVIPGWEFVELKYYTDFLKELSDQGFVVGHNRSATFGDSNDVDCAHPFQEGPITLVHNGTLRTTNQLPVCMSDLKGVTVDSHVICYNLAEVEPDEAEKVISKLPGSYALVWHDSRDKSVNIIRNSQRPLHFGLGVGNKTLYFASESGQLHWLNQRINLGIRDIYRPKENLLLKFHPETLEPETKQVKPQATSYMGTEYAGWTGTRGDFRGSAPAGDVTRNTSNDVFLGGRLAPVPVDIRRDLIEAGLTVRDRIHFMPLESMELNDSLCAVIGHLDSVGHPALITSFGKKTAENNFDRPWEVRPVGVKEAPDSKGNLSPLIICKLVSTFVTSNLGQEHFHAHEYGIGGDDDRANWSYTARSGSEDDDHFGVSAWDLLPGPGTYMGWEDWMDKTSDGCTLCGEDILATEAYNISWTEDKEPLCAGCSEKNPDLAHSDPLECLPIGTPWYDDEEDNSGDDGDAAAVIH